MKTPSMLLYRSLVALGLAAPFVLSQPLSAQSWDGGGVDNSWGTAANWVGDTLPAFTTTAPFATDLDLTFNNVTRPDNNVGIARGIRSITYGADMDSDFATSPRQSSAGGAADLNFSALTGNAKIEVLTGATGNITIGNSGSGTAAGSIVLGSNLDVVHNGTGLLLLNRPVTGSGGLTKTGTGTLELRAFNTATGVLNIDAGTVIAGSQAASGQDINSFSGVNLRGGTLMVRTQFANKAIDTTPVTVSSASTLEMQGVTSGGTNYNVTFGGTAGFVLNADLTFKNTSTLTTLTNGLTVGRAITGSGNITVETYNDIASNTVSYGLGRFSLTGDNTGWSGDLIIAKGTVSLGGALLAGQASGTGSIVLGKVGDAAGAGLTFFSTAATTTTTTYGNDIIVNTGGFRSIKGGNTDHAVTFTGAVTLNKNLNVDHTLSSVRAITFTGEISGAGGLDITRASGSAASSVILTGANSYGGGTTIASGATLALGNGGTSGSILGNVANNGTLVFNRSDDISFNGVVSGAGGLTKTGAGLLTLGAVNSYTGATTVSTGTLALGASNAISSSSAIILGGGTLNLGGFSPAAFTNALTMTASSTIDFGAHVTGINLTFANSSLATWTGSLTLLNFTVGTDNLSFTSIAGLDSTRLSQISLTGFTATGLDSSGNVQFSAVPEPGTFALLGGLAALGFTATRRRRTC